TAWTNLVLELIFTGSFRHIMEPLTADAEFLLVGDVAAHLENKAAPEPFRFGASRYRHQRHEHCHRQDEGQCRSRKPHFPLPRSSGRSPSRMPTTLLTKPSSSSRLLFTLGSRLGLPSFVPSSRSHWLAPLAKPRIAAVFSGASATGMCDAAQPN